MGSDREGSTADGGGRDWRHQDAIKVTDNLYVEDKLVSGSPSKTSNFYIHLYFTTKAANKK